MVDYDFDDNELPIIDDEARERFQAPCLLANNGIPCLIFGEEALCLVFLVPTMLFALHIMVADSHTDQAMHTITSSLPYAVYTNKLISNYNNPAWIDPEETRAYPRSIFLARTAKDGSFHPALIIVHPETDFHLDVSNYDRSTPVDMYPGLEFPPGIRLPTQAAMVDAIIDTTLGPNQDFMIYPVLRHFRLWLAYIIGYGTRVEHNVLLDGRLDYRAQALIDLLKEENRPFFEAFIRGKRSPLNSSEHRKLRDDIMRRKE